MSAQSHAEITHAVSGGYHPHVEHTVMNNHTAHSECLLLCMADSQAWLLSSQLVNTGKDAGFWQEATSIGAATRHVQPSTTRSQATHSQSMVRLPLGLCLATLHMKLANEPPCKHTTTNMRKRAHTQVPSNKLIKGTLRGAILSGTGWDGWTGV